MSKTSVKINRLEIRLKAASPHFARILVGGLGNNLLEQISRQRDHLRQNRRAHVHRVDAGTLKVNHGTAPSDLRRSVATKIARTISGVE